MITWPSYTCDFTQDVFFGSGHTPPFLMRNPALPFVAGFFILDILYSKPVEVYHSRILSNFSRSFYYVYGTCQGSSIYRQKLTRFYHDARSEV